jgi:Trm5-related predicted tRNA methylase
MRPGEYWEAILAWQADKEADRRHVAEVIRGVGVRLFNIQLRAKDQIRDVRQFLPLPWDDESPEDAEIERLNNLSPEEKAEEANAFLKRLKIRD